MKKEPAFLTTSEIIKYHQLLTRQFGGENGVRSHDLLESAIAMPSATFDGKALDCKWDADRQEASIKLPVQSANAPARVNVKY